MQIIVNPDRREWAELLKRAQTDDQLIASRVEKIVDRVRNEGDGALLDLSQSIDGVELTSVIVSSCEIEQASSEVDPKLKSAIEIAAQNIHKFHLAQLSQPIDIETVDGVRCMQKAVPIQRVGLYIPGGSAPLFSTVLMLAIPAKVAGCKDIILCSPPNKQGRIAAEVLYTAALCGVTKIFKIGGAQAIAAMAYSTASVPKVDKIFGPGNRYVTKAKQILSTSQVAIDMPAGPSEVMVLADSTARAEFVAADMLSQAEHGADSQAIAVVDSMSLCVRIKSAISEQLKILSRGSVARESLDNSRIIVMDSREDMIDFANEYAAEHLIISMGEPWSVAEQITSAGSIFIGNFSPESAGDYASGTNHTLPTYGWAKSFSGVNVDSFIRKITYQEITQQGLGRLGDTVITMANAEGLDAHANAVKIRLNKA